MDEVGSEHLREICGDTQTSADLLAVLALPEVKEATRNVAAKELIRRHFMWMEKFVQEQFGEQLDPMISAEDVALEALQRAVRFAESYSSPKEASSEDVERAVRGWLKRIAQNLFIDMLRGETRQPDIVRGVDIGKINIPVSSATDENQQELSQDVLALLEALRSLPEKQRRVLLAYAEMCDLTDNNCSLPDNIADELARELGLTRASLRVYKQRALKAVSSQLQKANVM